MYIFEFCAFMIYIYDITYISLVLPLLSPDTKVSGKFPIDSRSESSDVSISRSSCYMVGGAKYESQWEGLSHILWKIKND